MSMLNRIAKQPVSLMICLAWIVVWVFVVTNKNTLDSLCGKGIKQIGNQLEMDYNCLRVFMIHQMKDNMFYVN